MRALNVPEIDNLAASLKPLLGCRLQEVVVGATGVGLGFWTRGQGLTWLWFENHSWSPLFLPLTNVPERNLKPLKPLALFLRAHFIDRALQSVTRDERLGRALRLRFSADEGESRHIEVYLWPHGGNFLAFAEKRRVAWHKVEPVTAEVPAAPPNPVVRSLQELVEEWAVLRDNRLDRGAKARPDEAQQKKMTVEKRHQTELARLNRAIDKVQAEISSKKNSGWRDAGDWMVSHQSVQVPDDYVALVDKRRSLAWNIENCFTRAKELSRKLGSTEERLNHLQDDLARVQGLTAEEFAKTATVQRGQQKPVKGAARYRTVDVAGGLTARLGRSGADNLNLLRSARAWDMWLHLRDHPGSHAILSREKQKVVSDEALREVGIALVEQTFGNKAGQHKGERFELIVAECRFVRPVRGDKKGRVTYTHDRTVGFKFS